MGTLKEQPVRQTLNISVEDNIRFLEELKEIESATGYSINTILESRKIMEYSRRNDLFVANGDIHDEQMSGLGDLLENLTQAVYDLQNND
nr:hypothetical protein [uncultured Carboxylicivirga sp.]